MHATRTLPLTVGERCRREQGPVGSRQEQAAKAAEHERLRQEHAASCLLLASLGRRHVPLD